jgi:hypothetical protein
MPLAQERYHLDRHDYGRRLSIPFLRGYDQIGATGIVRSLELDLLTRDRDNDKRAKAKQDAESPAGRASSKP